jgi:hypothetical protein
MEWGPKDLAGPIARLEIAKGRHEVFNLAG